MYLERGILSAEECVRRKDLTQYTSMLQRASEADLILETVAEDFSVKRDILSAVDACRKKQSILASNSSSLDLETLSDCLQNSTSFLGVHFFNPALRILMVEVAPTGHTSSDCLHETEEWIKCVGKEPICVRPRAGLVVNRLMAGYIVQAFRLWSEGVAKPADIDRLSAGVLGHPIGPLALADLIGLDVVQAILENLSISFPDSGLSPPDLLQELVRRNHLGRKTGQGVFTYSANAILKPDK
jgi:3-hydroxybutyryl-CoA dehydrogenase